MSCPTNDVLIDLCDQRLGGEFLERIETHLLDCGDCRARFEDVRAVAETIRRSAVPFPADMDRRMAAVFAAPPRRTRGRLIWAAAAAVLVCAVAYELLPRASRPQPPWPAPSAGTKPVQKMSRITGPSPRPEFRREPLDLEPPREVGLAQRTPLSGHGFPAGDLNADGEVDVADRLLLVRHLARGTPKVERADLNGDMQVDVADLRLLDRVLRREIASTQ